MSEKQLTPALEAEISQIRRQWAAEAEPYLNAPKQDGAVLDGQNSAALAKIQLKYKKKIRDLVEASE